MLLPVFQKKKRHQKYFEKASPKCLQKAPFYSLNADTNCSISFIFVLSLLLLCNIFYTFGYLKRRFL
jgi:hypothetical protein